MKKLHIAAAIGLWTLSQPSITTMQPYSGQREIWQGRGKRPKPKVR